MMNSFDDYKNIIEDYIIHHLPNGDRNSEIVREAMEYSLLAGGKRLRPVLLLASAEFSGMNLIKALPYALAVEYIHTYSLIHDDLPAMDNDDLRRGKPTNHKVFGEGMAILAGDALLNSAYEIMIKDLMMYFDKKDELVKRIKAIYSIAKAAGIQGMIGGQVADVYNENKVISKDTLNYIHMNKTAALIVAPIRAGLYLGNSDDITIRNMTIYGENLGLAFQIADDILDVRGDSLELGKNTGSDESSGKNTFVSKYGLKEAEKKLKEVTNKAVDAVEPYENKGLFFKNLVLELAERTA